MNPMMTDLRIDNQPKLPIIVALDFPDEGSTLKFVRQLSPELCRLKVGKELFTSTGRQLVEKLIHQGFEVFLDLKYHDIPNTVAAACRVAADMGVWMIDMHVSGGVRMMESAVNAIAHTTHRPLLIGVTVLTSMESSDLLSIGLDKPINQLVVDWAKLAKQAGLDGVVCSAWEAQALSRTLGQDFVLVTPGIRLDEENTHQDDQRRIMTPKSALASGSHYLVIGRPITRAQHPSQVLQEIQQQIMK